MYYIYWIIDRKNKKTYVGHTDNIERRVKEHKNKTTQSTRFFEEFEIHILEEIRERNEARQREKYWKSAAGRKKLKILYNIGPIV